MPNTNIRNVETVAVLGAGTMGHGIAQVCAMSGSAVRLYDLDESAVSAGLARIEKNLAKGVDKGKVTEALQSETLGRLTTHTSVASAVTGADLVVEAAPEKLEIKQSLFAEVAKHVDATAILGTNTSSLSVANIAASVPHPERVIGLHFFNPVHIMKLLEIIVAKQTSDEVLASMQAYGERIGKQTITVKDFPGFATSRLGLVIGLEAIRMVEQGVASAEDIDKAMTLGYGFPMGPLKLTDLVGLDVRLHIAEYLSTHLEGADHFKPPQLLRDMVAEGKLGKKSGQGFYTW